MFTDKELDILEFEILPIVSKYNDLQKVFDNLDEDYIDLFLKWCDYEGIDTSKITIGTYGREENDILYLCGSPKKGYQKYEGGEAVGGSPYIEKVITETPIILPESCSEMFKNCNKLEIIIGADKGDTSKVKNMYGMFYRCNKLESIDVSNGDVSNVVDMRDMFCACGKLSDLNISNGDVSNVKYIGYMFFGCERLTNLDVSKGDVSNIRNFWFIFYGCRKLTSLDISNGNVSNARIMTNMFCNCRKIEELDVSKGDVSNVQSIDDLFYNCCSLKRLKGILDGNLESLISSVGAFRNTKNLENRTEIIKKIWS